jgi:UDPglucose 6-dehydrogenase
MLMVEGATIRGYEPVGSMEFGSDMFTQVSSIEEACEGASAAIVATEWKQVCEADWKTLCESMASPRLVFDGRNCLDRAAVRDGGGDYVGVGRR